MKRYFIEFKGLLTNAGSWFRIYGWEREQIDHSAKILYVKKSLWIEVLKLVVEIGYFEPKTITVRVNN